MIVIGLLTIFIAILGYIFNRVYSTNLCAKMSKRKYNPEYISMVLSLSYTEETICLNAWSV